MKRFLMTVIALLLTAIVYGVPTDSNFGVGPQYDTTHVYVRPENFDGFVASLLATFGGTATKQGVFTVTPTPSQTMCIRFRGLALMRRLHMRAASAITLGVMNLAKDRTPRD